ncbi:phytanoyl-CoA dioxygenase domain-containing protein 1 homolog [Argopecten irradians]|uniref:phytanoyl-CoA dioxygenase domain-containing protein 1 homolog n=1 Tax=Argopecten irradians TaxID=31199 RepID=UPI00371979C3
MSKVKFPGDTDEAHPEKFNLEAMPPQPKERKPGQLPEDMIKQFFTEGFVVVEDFFKTEELEACKDAIRRLIDEMALKLYNAGKIKKLYTELGFYERLTAIEKEFPGANIVLHKLGAMPLEIQQLWSNERLLNVIEQLIGPDIIGHPVWNLRTKTPQNEATTVPWHQDVGYLDNSSYTVLQPTAWIPLLDTDENNGCMQMMSKGHKTGKIATHQCCHGGTWYVMLEEEEMKKSLDIDVENDKQICPIPYRGMLLFNNLIPHRSLPNMSKQIRWSFDLRWQRPSEPVGFYGIKEGILMRSSKDPDMKIDWEEFNGLNRHVKAQEAVTGQDVNEEFDITIQGPWMKKWEIVHVNHHVNAHREQEGDASKWTKA